MYVFVIMCYILLTNVQFIFKQKKTSGIIKSSNFFNIFCLLQLLTPEITSIKLWITMWYVLTIYYLYLIQTLKG